MREGGRRERRGESLPHHKSSYLCPTVEELAHAGTVGAGTSSHQQRHSGLPHCTLSQSSRNRSDLQQKKSRLSSCMHTKLSNQCLKGGREADKRPGRKGVRPSENIITHYERAFLLQQA